MLIIIKCNNGWEHHLWQESDTISSDELKELMSRLDELAQLDCGCS